MTKVKFQLESAGYCTAKKSIALRGASNKTIKFYATFGHIEHPKYGHILFDTGYSCRFYKATKKLPFWLYAKLTKVYVSAQNEAVNMLKIKGIDAAEVKFIIVSHFHADHIGGLKDFPLAKFICSKKAYDDIINKRGIFALKKGFIPSLLPKDFEERVEKIEFIEEIRNQLILGKSIDLFNDGTIILCELDGHAKGQIGAVINAEKKVFLISDAAWLVENYKTLHLPSPIVRLFFDSWKDFKTSLIRVHNYAKANPKTEIIPCHCEQTFKRLSQVK